MTKWMASCLRSACCTPRRHREEHIRSRLAPPAARGAPGWIESSARYLDTPFSLSCLPWGHFAVCEMRQWCILCAFWSDSRHYVRKSVTVEEVWRDASCRKSHIHVMAITFLWPSKTLNLHTDLEILSGSRHHHIKDTVSVRFRGILPWSHVLVG